jgi:hypothetical protein
LAPTSTPAVAGVEVVALEDLVDALALGLGAAVAAA